MPLLRLNSVLYFLLAFAFGAVACSNDNPATTDVAPAGADNDGGRGDDPDGASGKPDAGAASRTTKDAGKPTAVTKDSSADVAKDSGALDATADASGVVVVPVDASAKPARQPGKPGEAESRSVMVGSAKRTFLLYIPSGLDKAAGVPFVSVHHGFTMTGTIMDAITTWKVIAEREGIVVAFPDGGAGAGPWNVGSGVCSPGDSVSADASQDDLGFVKAMIESANGMQAIDKTRVFVGGFSMGGFFANNAGCKGRDFIRAIAAASSGSYPGDCPGKAIPVLMIHGDADGLIDYTSCGQAAYKSWITRNGCSSDVDTEAVKQGSCAWNKGCPAGQELGFCTMKGMNHGWAGAEGTGNFAAALTYAGPMDNVDYGGGTQYEDGAEMMWKFFRRQ